MYDTAIIGGGLTGCATAWRLTEDGAKVILLERDEINSAASGANAGSLHVQIPHDPFVRLGPDWAAAFSQTLPLLLDSIDLWREIESRLGTDLEVSMTGGLLVAASEAEMRQIERKAAIERAAGVTVELLSASALKDRAPYLSGRLAGGAYCPTEGKANPLLCAPAFAKAANRLGASLLSGCEVAAIERGREGFELTTSQGLVKARRIVNAAGAASGRIAQMAGMRMDIEAFPIQLSVTAPAAPLVSHLVYAAAEKLTLKQTRAGSIIIGGGWPARLDAAGRPVVDPKALARNVKLAVDTVPGLADVELLRTWAAFVNGNADWRPIIGEAPGAPGFFMAYAPWIGFTASLATASIVADLARGKTPQTRADLSCFAPR